MYILLLLLLVFKYLLFFLMDSTASSIRCDLQQSIANLSIRRVGVGRKNYLFAGTHVGAK